MKRSSEAYITKQGLLILQLKFIHQIFIYRNYTYSNSETTVTKVSELLKTVN